MNTKLVLQKSNKKLLVIFLNASMKNLLWSDMDKETLPKFILIGKMDQTI